MKQFQDKLKLNESPDKVIYKDDLLGYRHTDAEEEVLRSIEKAMYKKHKIRIDFNDEDWLIEVLETDIELSYIDWRERENYIEKLIPLKDYVGSLNPPDHIKILHQLDAKNKREELKRWGYKSKTRETSKLSPVEYRDKISKYHFTEKFNDFINENADTFYINQKKITFTNPNSYPFAHNGKKILFGITQTTHSDSDILFEDSHIDGRIWLNYKVIAFWNLISDNLIETFNEIANQFYLRHDIKIDFFDGEWKISLEEEVVDELDLYVISDYYINGQEYCLVKLEDYINSKNTSRIEQDDEIRDLHLNKNKREILLKQGYKSKTKETSKLPPAAYKDKISKYHFTESFKLFESPD